VSVFLFNFNELKINYHSIKICVFAFFQRFFHIHTFLYNTVLCLIKGKVNLPIKIQVSRSQQNTAQSTKFSTCSKSAGCSDVWWPCCLSWVLAAVLGARLSVHSFCLVSSVDFIFVNNLKGVTSGCKEHHVDIWHRMRQLTY